MENWKYTLITERYLDMLEQHCFGGVSNVIVDNYFREHLRLDNNEQFVIFHQGEDYIK